MSEATIRKDRFSFSVPKIHNRIRLMTTYYPGDMDKIAYKDAWTLGQDALAAHQLMEWVRAFQNVVQAGTAIETPEGMEMWQAVAKNFLSESKKVV